MTRTGLRLAAILALTRNYSQPWPTIAEDRVYDSRLDPVQFQNKSRPLPTLIVYTDTDASDPLSENNGGPPWRRHVNLVLELMVGMIEGSEPEGFTYGLPATDAELESLLDLFEHQVRYAVTDPGNAWSRLLQRAFLIRIVDWSSERMATAEGGVRLSGRQVTVRVEIPDDALPQVLFTGEEVPELPECIQELIDALEGSPNDHTTQVLTMLQAAGVPVGLTLDKLKTIYAETVPPDGTHPVTFVTNLDTADTADTA